jgi:hypothetical protein
MATSLLSPSAKQQFFDAAGHPASGFKLYTYAANTLTPQATYTNRSGLSANANPIILDARGEAIIYLTPGVVYDYVLKTGADAAVWTREDIIADAGDANAVTFIQSGTDAISRNLQDKNREIVSINDFSTGLAGAIANGKEFIVPAGDYTVSSISNALGIEYSGDGRILKNITGGQQQLNSKAYDGQHVFGQQFLQHFHNRIHSNPSLSSSMVFSGDSTTEGGATHAVAPYRIHELVTRLGINRGHWVTGTNAGHSSKHTQDWVDDYIAPDLALNPNLYVVRWGINDPFYGRSINDFATSLRTGLATIRASKNLSQMSILLMTPNATTDTPNDRDERWYEKARLVVRQAAKDYQCAFIDTYALWQDARAAATLWMDDPFGDGRAIHPYNIFNVWIASAMADLLFPPGLRTPLLGSAAGLIGVGSLPRLYPYGYSLNESAATGWPGMANGQILTWKSEDNGVYQMVYTKGSVAGDAAGGYPMPQIAERMGNSFLDEWKSWITEPAIDLTSVLANGWVNFSGTNIARAKKTRNQCTLSGLVKSGTTANGTVILTLPVGYRPRNASAAFVVATGAVGTFGTIYVASNGQVTIQGGGNATFMSLDQIQFEVGG